MFVFGFFSHLFFTVFATTHAFNQPLNWETGKVTDMKAVFLFASAFNKPLNWNTENVTDMYESKL